MSLNEDNEMSIDSFTESFNENCTSYDESNESVDENDETHLVNQPSIKSSGSVVQFDPKSFEQHITDAFQKSNVSQSSKQSYLFLNNSNNNKPNFDLSYTNLKKLDSITIIDKLQAEADNFVNLFNDIQTKNASLEGMIHDLLCQKNTKSLNEMNHSSDSKHREYFYRECDFMPNMHLKYENYKSFSEFEMSQKLKQDLNLVRHKFKYLLERFKKFNKEISQSFRVLSDLFTFIDFANFATNSFSDFGIDDKNGLLIFYISITCAYNGISNKMWQDNINKIKEPNINVDSILNNTLGYPDDIKKIYMNNSLSKFLNFANKYCKFPRKENIEFQAGFLIEFSKNLSDIIEFFDNPKSIDDIYNAKIDWETQFINKTFSNDIYKYFKYKLTPNLPLLLNEAKYSHKRKSEMLNNFDHKSNDENVYFKKAKNINLFDELKTTLTDDLAAEEFSNIRSFLNINKKKTVNDNSNGISSKSTNINENKKSKTRNEKPLINACKLLKKNINVKFLKSFFLPFGSIISNDDEDLSFSLNHDILTSSNISKASLNEFMEQIETWPNMFLFIQLYLNKFDTNLKNFNTLFDSIYSSFANSIWFCNYSIENKKLDPSKIKYPSLISFRESSILMHIQTKKVSTIPARLMLNEFCFSFISIILSLYCIGYFQNKRPSNQQEKCLQEVLLLNNNQLSLVTIAKIVDFIYFLLSSTFDLDDLGGYVQYDVKNEKEFNDLMPIIFSSINVMEFSSMNLLHRSADLTSQNEINILSRELLRFLNEFTTGNKSLSDFKVFDNHYLDLKSVVEQLFTFIKEYDHDNLNNMKKSLIKGATGIVRYGEFEEEFINLTHYLLVLNMLPPFDASKKWRIFKLVQNQMKEIRKQLINLTWIKKNANLDIFSKSSFINEFFKNSPYFNQNHQHFIVFMPNSFTFMNKYDSFEIELDEWKRIYTEINASQIFLYNNGMRVNFCEREYQSKIVQFKRDAAVLSIENDFTWVLNIVSILDREYGYNKWQITRDYAVINSIETKNNNNNNNDNNNNNQRNNKRKWIPAHFTYLTDDNMFMPIESIDEFLCDNMCNYNQMYSTISQDNDVYVYQVENEIFGKEKNLLLLFQINPYTNIFKEQLESQNYSYFYNKKLKRIEKLQNLNYFESLMFTNLKKENYKEIKSSLAPNVNFKNISTAKANCTNLQLPDNGGINSFNFEGDGLFKMENENINSKDVYNFLNKKNQIKSKNEFGEKEKSSEFSYDKNIDFTKNDDHSSVLEVSIVLEQLNKEIRNIEYKLYNISNEFQTFATIRLIENVALQHFLNYPYYYMPSKNFKISQFITETFPDIFLPQSDFIIRIENLNLFLQKLKRITDKSFGVFINYYNFFCKKSLVQNLSFGNVLLPQQTKHGKFFTHITALFILYLHTKRHLVNNNLINFPMVI